MSRIRRGCDTNAGELDTLPCVTEVESSERPIALPGLAAGALAFFVSAAVLVLEVLGVRVLAPYVGNTLQTYTAIIGTVLTGISLGTWLGGRVADRFDPRRVLGVLMVAGGAAVLLLVPIVRDVGPSLTGDGELDVTLLAFATLFLPAALLSAINPALVKLQLSDLGTTGRVVGRLSAIATAGAIVGTFTTGFLLVATIPVSQVIRMLGALLAAIGVVLHLLLARRPRKAPPVLIGAALVSLVFSSFAFGPEEICDQETAYYCIRVVNDANDPSGRYLWMDDLLHSYADLDDPTRLAFGYTRRLGAAADAVRPVGRPVVTLSIGGGGMTLPRYVAATRPGSEQTVLEVDPAVVEVAYDQMGVQRSPDLHVKVGDARIGVVGLPSNTFDFVTGDAFGQEAVPWQLTTREFLEHVRATMTSDGVYAMNIIDHAERNFLRAELRTLRDVFDDVLLVTDSLDDIEGDANYVVVASPTRVDVEALRARLADHEPSVVVRDADLTRFIADAELLTDDYAPVDQLITSASKSFDRG
jgi:MFS family permease